MKLPKNAELIIGISVIITTVMVHLILHHLFQELKMTEAIVASGATVILIWGMGGIIWLLGRKTYEPEIESVLHELRGAVKHVNYPWLFGASHINEVERTIDCQEIWIISPDLAHDTGKPAADILAVIRENQKRGIKYIYLVPDTDRINAVLPDLKRTFEKHPEKLSIITLPEKEFKTLSPSHVVIYDPNMNNRPVPLVFLELPVEQRNPGRGYWVQVHDDSAFAFTGRFRPLIEKERSHEL